MARPRSILTLALTARRGPSHQGGRPPARPREPPGSSGSPIPPMPASPEIEAMDLLRTITLALTQYRAFHASLAELKGCSDRELSDLGIARHDIARVAYLEAERRAGAPVPSRTVPAATTVAAAEA